MTPPKDRDELVELMARALCNADYETALDYGVSDTYPDWEHSNENRRDICREHADKNLDALEAAGCTVCPNEATEEMVIAALVSSAGTSGKTDAAIAASPYRRKP